MLEKVAEYAGRTLYWLRINMASNIDNVIKRQVLGEIYDGADADRYTHE